MVSLIDVTLRDGISRFSTVIPTNKKIKFAQLVLKAGFNAVEVTEFGSKNLQYEDNEKVVDALKQYAHKLRVMCNRAQFINELLLKPLQCVAFVAGVDDDYEMSRNGRTSNQALQEALNVCYAVKGRGKDCSAVIAGAFGKEGGKMPKSLISMINAFSANHIKDIVLADLYGTAPLQTVQDIWKTVTKRFKGLEFTLHFHGTHAIENMQITYEMGAQSFEVAFHNNHFPDPRPNTNAVEAIQMLRRYGENILPSEEEIKKINNMWQS